jgi:hypothetical protein
VADAPGAVYSSAAELLATVRHPELPGGGVYDHEIAAHCGLGLDVVRAALSALGSDRLHVDARGSGPWVVLGIEQ